MARSHFAVSIALAMASTTSIAGEFADVVSSEPIYQTVTEPAAQRCWNESQEVADPNAKTKEVAGTVIGAIAGGVVGHQFGGGRGKKLATAGGAVAGGVVGNQIGSGAGQPGTQTVQKCEQVGDARTRQELTGYRIQYRYGGSTYQTTSRTKPGAKIPVEVTVRALVD